jgi:hypothetical protein
VSWVLGLLLVWDTNSWIARSHAAAYFRSLAVPDSARESTRQRALVHWAVGRAGGSVDWRLFFCSGAHSVKGAKIERL